MASDSDNLDVEAARQEIASGDALAVDVRSEEEWREGHVPGAIHLPDGEAGAEGERPEKGARLMVIAKDGKLAARAAANLSELGYDAVAVDGDMDDWVSEDFKTQPSEDPDEDSDLSPD